MSQASFLRPKFELAVAAWVRHTPFPVLVDVGIYIIRYTAWAGDP